MDDEHHGQHRDGDGLMKGCCQAKVDLARRWNLAASAGGMIGSEYIDEPENVFRRVIQDRQAFHNFRGRNK